MDWIWLIIVGALVGTLGRLFHPGSDPMGWIVTILLGIASLVVAGLIFSGLWQFVVGIIVAIVLHRARRALLLRGTAIARGAVEPGPRPGGDARPRAFSA